MKNAFVSTLIKAILILAPTQVLAWGPEGHQIVAYVGSNTQALEVPFFVANRESMRRLSTVPDREWKDPKTKPDEESTHWFQADAYEPDLNRCEDLLQFPRNYRDAVAKYGAAKVFKNGSAIWRVVQMYNAALDSFRNGDQVAALTAAGVMTHYIGDLAMPLHVSENYDGQKTGNRGIHAFFETQIIDKEFVIREDVAKRAELLLKDPKFLSETEGDLADVINHQVVRSLLKRDELLRNDSKNGRKTSKAIATQLELAKDRMADGAATLAVVLKRLSEEANLTNEMNSTLTVSDPKWVAPNYY